MGGQRQMGDVYFPVKCMSYNYSSQIKTPSELGMGDKGNIKTLGNDVKGIQSYIDLLVDGSSKASKAPDSGPLGNRYFLDTGTTCTGGKQRYLYIDNVAKDEGSGRGLMQSLTQSIRKIVPDTSEIYSTEPINCSQVSLQVIDANGNVGSETQYVAVKEIAELSPCLFTDKVNPVAKTVCGKKGKVSKLKEQTKEQKDKKKKKKEKFENYIQSDVAVQIYFAAIGLAGIFILYKLTR